MFTPYLGAAALAFAIVQSPALAAPLTLDQAIDLAVQRSEAVRASRSSVQSAAEAARAAGQLPDPVLRAGIDNLPVTGSDRFSTARDSMTMKRIGIGQEWLSSEKRAARQAAADAMTGRERAQRDIAIAETRLQAALAYVDAFYAGEMLKLSSLLEHHAQEAFEAARARLASPSGSSEEALALKGALGLAEDESSEARQVQSAASLALQRWLGRQSDELVPPALHAAPTEGAFVEASASVVLAQRDIELAGRESAVASANRKPNWSWEVSYGQRSGYSDMVSFGVSIPLPVAPSQRQDRETASKLTALAKAQAVLAEASRAATAEYRTLKSDAERLTARIERYRETVVVPAQQRTEAALAGYRSNQVGLMAFFEARHAEVEARRKLLMLQRNLAKAQMQLGYKPIATGGAQ